MLDVSGEDHGACAVRFSFDRREIEVAMPILIDNTVYPPDEARSILMDRIIWPDDGTADLRMSVPTTIAWVNVGNIEWIDTEFSDRVPDGWIDPPPKTNKDE